MKLIVRAVHLKLSPSLLRHVETRLRAPIEHVHDDEAAELDVHLIKDHGKKGGEARVCSVTLFSPGAKPLHISETSDSLYKSIDLARDRLERRLKRERSRERSLIAHRPESREARSRWLEAAAEL